MKINDRVQRKGFFCQLLFINDKNFVAVSAGQLRCLVRWIEWVTVNNNVRKCERVGCQFFQVFYSCSHKD